MEPKAKIRIAVVDDERILLRVFSSLMRRFNYEADFYSNPQKAVDAIVADPGRYDLVLSDVRMPGMDGVSFARKVRFLLPDLPIIFMTEDVSDELKSQITGLGNATLVEKPFPLETTLKELIPQFLIMRH